MRKAEARFWGKVAKDGPNGCWIWKGTINYTGYGSFGDRTSHVTQAHRFSYELAKGPIPEGLEIDHLCRVRNCVNPDHLEAVTHQENLRRGVGPAVTRQRHAARTHCKNGHLFDESNTAYDWKGARRCIECGRIRARRSGVKWRATHQEQLHSEAHRIDQRDYMRARRARLAHV